MAPGRSIAGEALRVTPEAATLMRQNLMSMAQQQDALALKAKSPDDAEHFRRGAATYRRLLTTLPERDDGRARSDIDPPQGDHHDERT